MLRSSWLAPRKKPGLHRLSISGRSVTAALCALLVAACSGEAFTSGPSQAGDAGSDVEVDGTAGAGGSPVDAATSGTGGEGGEGGDGGEAEPWPPGPCPGTTAGCVIDWVGSHDTPGIMSGVGTNARLDSPRALVVHDGLLFVSAAHVIYKIEIATGHASIIAGKLDGSSGHLDDRGTLARFNQPAGLATDGTTLWVAERGNHVIRAVGLVSGQVTTFAGMPTPGYANGAGAEARFNQPTGLFYHEGRLFVADTGNHSVRQIDVVTRLVSPLAGDPGNGSGAGDGRFDQASFNAPQGVTLLAGVLYVADTGNHRVRAIASDGWVSTVFGAEKGFRDGTEPLLSGPNSLSADGDELWISDALNFVVRRAVLDPLLVETRAGTPGAEAHSVGLGAAAGFEALKGLVIDPDSADAFIVDGHAVRRMYR